MGNYKFRLSDMMPNAWFYKLRDMSLATTTRNPHSNPKKKPTKSTKTFSQKSHNSSSHPNQPRQSYHYSSDFSTASKTTSFDDPPRRSSTSKQNRRARRKTVYKPSPRRTPPSSADHNPCSCQCLHHHHHHHQHDLDFVKSPISSEFESEAFEYANESRHEQASRSSSCSCGFSSSATDIIIDVESRSYVGFDAMLEVDLPPILTRPALRGSGKNETYPDVSSACKDRETVSVNAGSQKEPANRKSVSSGIKLRGKANSPRIQPNSSRRKSVSRRSKTAAARKEGFAESFAIVKASVDPERDFRESMMEMIVENNIRASKDLEELLACYLSLNSDEYHGLIIKAFEQIWFNLPDLNS